MHRVPDHKINHEKNSRTEPSVQGPSVQKLEKCMANGPAKRPCIRPNDGGCGKDSMKPQFASYVECLGSHATPRMAVCKRLRGRFYRFRAIHFSKKWAEDRNSLPARWSWWNRVSTKLNHIAVSYNLAVLYPLAVPPRRPPLRTQGSPPKAARRAVT